MQELWRPGTQNGQIWMRVERKKKEVSKDGAYRLSDTPLVRWERGFSTGLQHGMLRFVVEEDTREWQPQMEDEGTTAPYGFCWDLKSRLGPWRPSGFSSPSWGHRGPLSCGSVGAQCPPASGLRLCSSLWCRRDKGWDGAPKTLLMVWWSESPESPQPQPFHATKSWEQVSSLPSRAPVELLTEEGRENQTHCTSPELTSCWRRCPLVRAEWGLALGASPTGCTL